MKELKFIAIAIIVALSVTFTVDGVYNLLNRNELFMFIIKLGYLYMVKTMLLSTILFGGASVIISEFFPEEKIFSKDVSPIGKIKAYILLGAFVFLLGLVSAGVSIFTRSEGVSILSFELLSLFLYVLGCALSLRLGYLATRLKI